MKRTSHARFVGVGRQVPEIVDKPSVHGRVFNDPEIIAAQLRGEPDLRGERSTSEAARRSVVNERLARRRKAKDA